jgi:hypothetical protein
MGEKRSTGEAVSYLEAGISFHRVSRSHRTYHRANRIYTDPEVRSFREQLVVRLLYSNREETGSLQETNSKDVDAIGVLEIEEREIKMYRRYSAYFGYIFTISQKK